MGILWQEGKRCLCADVKTTRKCLKRLVKIGICCQVFNGIGKLLRTSLGIRKTQIANLKPVY